MTRTWFVTGSSTGVGKTVVACLLARHLRERGKRVAVFKPLCSGGREDARKLWQAGGRELPLDVVNPWSFRAPIAPLLAARQQCESVTLRQVVNHIRRFSRGFDAVLIEGAGGLLSPMGEDFDSRTLLEHLAARPVIVVENTLGAVNQARLVLDALPRAQPPGHVVLSGPRGKHPATESNARLLAEFHPSARIHEISWLRPAFTVRVPSRLKATIAAVLEGQPRGKSVAELHHH